MRYKLSEARKRRGLTQGELAELVGATQSMIQRVECGLSECSAPLAQKLIACLGVTLDDCVRIDAPEPIGPVAPVASAISATGELHYDRDES